MTQSEQIRQHLEAGKTITPAQALIVYGISRLSSCVEDLRLTGMAIDCLLKRDEMGRQYGEYSKRRPITQGCKVQVKPGHGYGLPAWVRSLRLSEVILKDRDTSLVEFVRGKNKKAVWCNDKELIAAHGALSG